MIRASGADDDVAPYPRLLSRKLRFLVIADKLDTTKAALDKGTLRITAAKAAARQVHSRRVTDRTPVAHRIPLH
jgi:hypothetical protein